MDPVRDFLLDSNGDLAVVNGDFAGVAGAAAVPQGIRTRTLMFEGESFLDVTVGVKWLTDILIKNPDPSNVRSILAKAIGKTPDVTSVLGAQLIQRSDRSASIDYQASTVYSDQPLAGKVETP